MKGDWKTFWSMAILIIFVALILVVSLFQLQASEPFSIDNIFSSENIAEAIIVFIGCLVLVMVFSRKK